MIRASNCLKSYEREHCASSPNVPQFERTHLYYAYACERGHVEIAKILLERGAAYVMFKPKEESGAQEAGDGGKQGAPAAPPPVSGGNKDAEVAENSVQPVYAAVSEGRYKILELMFDQTLVKKFDNKHLLFSVRTQSAALLISLIYSYYTFIPRTGNVLSHRTIARLCT